MGFSDTDFDKAKSVCDDAQLYKQAGNSIAVPVAERLLSKVLDYIEQCKANNDDDWMN